MRELAVERYLCKVVKGLGGEALKFTSPGRRHVQDRIVILPRGSITFVELKAPGKTPRAGQVRFRKRLEALGCACEILDTKEKIDAWAYGSSAEAWRNIL